MTRETQSNLLSEFYAEKKNVMKLKGEDYANEDVLSNFKTAGGNCGISAELQCLSLIATKVARLGNLLSGKTPNNESISDSILDLSNYTDLLYCLVNEETEISKFSEGILNDFKKFNDAADKNEADFLKRKHAKSQPLTLEECIEPKPQTKRWDNIAPHPMLDAIDALNKAILAGAQWHEKRREEAELIKDAYEPKVGDRFEDENGIILNVRKVTEEFVVFKYKHNGDLIIAVSWLTEFLSKIQSGTLKKIN